MGGSLRKKIKSIDIMNLGNRTEELISILRDTHHMKIREDKDGIFCDNGRLMDFPVKIWILPQFGRACFYVYLCKGCKIATDVIKMDIQYMTDIPMELLINAVVGYFKNELNHLITSKKINIENIL